MDEILQRFIAAEMEMFPWARCLRAVAEAKLQQFQTGQWPLPAAQTFFTRRNTHTWLTTLFIQNSLRKRGSFRGYETRAEGVIKKYAAKFEKYELDIVVQAFWSLWDKEVEKSRSTSWGKHKASYRWNGRIICDDSSVPKARTPDEFLTYLNESEYCLPMTNALESEKRRKVNEGLRAMEAAFSNQRNRAMEAAFSKQRK